MIKKFLQKIFKKISYAIFLKIYGKIEKSIDCSQDKRIKVEIVNIEKDLSYRVYNISDGRLYTDRIHDTAILLDNKIIEEPSFQLRYKGHLIHNSKIKDNIVFKRGTPRKLRNLNGTVLSLLTGGAGNENYSHWLSDVLPRIALCNKTAVTVESTPPDSAHRTLSVPTSFFIDSIILFLNLFILQLCLHLQISTTKFFKILSPFCVCTTSG